MKLRYRLIRRGERGAKFYCVDGETGRRTSLGEANEAEARQIVLAKNQAVRQPALNLHIARATWPAAIPAPPRAPGAKP